MAVYSIFYLNNNHIENIIIYVTNNYYTTSITTLTTHTSNETMTAFQTDFTSLDPILREKIDIASILEYLVAPFHHQFTDKVALFCAGVEWQTVNMYYNFQGSLVQRYFSHQKHHIRQCCGNTPLYSDDETLLFRYKYFIQYAQRWPPVEKLSEFERNLDSFEPLQTASGISRASAVRLVGGNPQIPSIKQATYRFDKVTFSPAGMRGRLYAKEGTILDPTKHLPCLNKDPKPHTQPQID